MNELFTLLKIMNNKHIQPNEVTLTLVMDVCSRWSQSEEDTKQAIDFVKEQIIGNKNISPNTTIYNAQIKACVQRGNMDAAYDILNTMKKKRVQPDIVTYNTLIDGE